MNRDAQYKLIADNMKGIVRDNVALRARVEKLGQELAESIESNTAAYMQGVEAGKKDAALLYEARVEKLERVREAAEGGDQIIRTILNALDRDAKHGLVVRGEMAEELRFNFSRVCAALAGCEEVEHG